MITIETTVNGEDKVLTFYQKDILEGLYEKYKKYKDENPAYAVSMRKFLETTYTNSTGGHGEILVCTFNSTTTTIKYEYDKNNIQGREEKVEQDEMSYSVVNYDIVTGKYGTPVEFLMNLLEITGSSDFVNAFISEVNKENEIVLGLYNMAITTTNVEQETYTQSTTIKGEINTGKTYCVRDNGIIEITDPNDVLNGGAFNSGLLNENNELPELGPIVSHTETPSSTPGKINISASGGFAKSGHTYTLYLNNQAINHYVLESDSDTAIWTELDEPTENKYMATKNGEGNVTVTTTDIITENGYDLGIKKVKCWWAEITMENQEVSNTEFVNLDEESVDGDTVDQVLTGVGLEEATQKVLESIQGEVITKEREEYTKTENPKIFRKSFSTVGNRDKEEFINSIYNYIKDETSIPTSYYQAQNNVTFQQLSGMQPLDSSTIESELETQGITKESYDYNSMLLTFKNALRKSSTIKQDKTVTYGVPTGDYAIEGILSLLRDNQGKVVEYADLYESKTGAGEMLVNGAEMLFQLLDSSENTEGLSDVMRYILYRYSGKDYGVKEFNDSILGDITFNGTSPIVLGNTIQDKVWFGLKSLGYSDISTAAAMGNIHYESESFNPNFIEDGRNEYNGGIGICQWTNTPRDGNTGRNSQLREFASKRGTVWQDPDLQVEFLMAELTGSGADGCAEDQLEEESTYTGITYYSSEWENAQDSEPLNQAKLKRLTEVFMFTFERPLETHGYNSLEERYNHALYYYKMYHGRSLSGGTEESSDTGNGIAARFTSNITGRTFTVWNQNEVGLRDKCNRASAASIASGYRPEGAAENHSIVKVKSAGSNVLSNNSSTEAYFNQYGLTAQIDQYSYSTINIKNLLTSGKYVCLSINTEGTGKAGLGKSGTTYCKQNYKHWIAIIGYNYNNGEEKIYVSDPGKFPGATGWHDLDEFDPIRSYINYFTVVSEK